jgi:DNA polymerase III alpha subunit
MHEFVINIHMHTRYSDGHGTHAEIARAALRAGLDAVIITDHNVQVDGPQGYFKEGGNKVLLIIGQEVHDQAREPQKITCWSSALIGTSPATPTTRSVWSMPSGRRRG